MFAWGNTRYLCFRSNELFLPCVNLRKEAMSIPKASASVEVCNEADQAFLPRRRHYSEDPLDLSFRKNGVRGSRSFGRVLNGRYWMDITRTLQYTVLEGLVMNQRREFHTTWCRLKIRIMINPVVVLF